MLKLTEAWRISDGRCFEKKMEAYKEQISLLFRTLPDTKNKPPTIDDFQKVIKGVDKWLADARSLLAQMGGEADTEVKRSIDGQG